MRRTSDVSPARRAQWRSNFDAFRAQFPNHEQPTTTQTPDAGAGREKPRSRRRTDRRKSPRRRQGAGTKGKTAAQVRRMRAGGAEG